MYGFFAVLCAVALAFGFTAALTSCEGPMGPEGKSGVDGQHGKDGQNGAAGASGQNGVDGQDGIDGQHGKDGQDGADGRDGVDGQNGIDGQHGNHPYIGENGNWWVGDADTGVSATPAISGDSQATLHIEFPTTTRYCQDQELDITGLKVQLKYEAGGVRFLSDAITDYVLYWNGSRITPNDTVFAADHGVKTVFIFAAGRVEEFEVTVEGHVVLEEDWTETLAPTCTVDGEKIGVCTRCSKADIQQVIPAFGHDYSIWAATAVATETENGMETLTCAHNSAHTNGTRPLYATGRNGLAYELITGGNNANTYRVRRGTVVSGAIHIPAYYRTTNNYADYKLVTEIGSVSDDYNTGAFSYSGNSSTIAVTFAAESQLKSIGGYAFQNRTGLTGITLPASVTTIGSQAFQQCTNLATVTFAPSSQLTTIDSYAFSSCTSLNNITLPAGVTTINSQAFYNCTGLTGITIPPSVTTIGQSAFYGCTNLITVTFAAGSRLTTINYGAFQNCTSLTGNINIPASVTTINNQAFYGCTGLTSITVAGNNPNYASQDGILYNKTKTDLMQAPAGISGAVTIPAGVTTIGSSAFSGCTGLTGITIPATVTNIYDSAFSGCTGLTGITIPASVTYINYYTFQGCTGLTSITIPANVTTINERAFYGCANLTTVTFAAVSRLATIGPYVFSGCTSLNSITLPASLTNISNYVFQNCTGLTGITIPANVTSIGSNAFASSGLTTVTFAAGSRLQTLSASAFANCASLNSITIPASVTTIGELAFNNCTGLTGITIPATVTTISRYAFSGCTGITSITIPATVTTAGQGLFYSWAAGQTVNVPFANGNKPAGWDNVWDEGCNAQIVYQ